MNVCLCLWNQTELIVVLLPLLFSRHTFEVFRARLHYISRLFFVWVSRIRFSFSLFFVYIVAVINYYCYHNIYYHCYSVLFFKQNKILFHFIKKARTCRFKLFVIFAKRKEKIPIILCQKFSNKNTNLVSA